MGFDARALQVSYFEKKKVTEIIVCCVLYCSVYVAPYYRSKHVCDWFICVHVGLIGQNTS